MPIELQTVELVNRARRAFDLRGSLQLLVDEVAVPVVQIYDATQAPFRLDGIAWARAGSDPGTAGVYTRIEVTPQQFNTTVVRQLIISNPNATAATFHWGPILSTFAAPVAISTEQPDQLVARVPIGLNVATNGVPQVGLAAAGNGVGVVRIPGETAIVIPLDILLQPGAGLAVEVQAVATGVSASFSGYYFRPR